MLQQLNIDNLSASINLYGSKIGNTNTKLNLSSLENTINNDKKPNNDFSSTMLIDKRQKRREEKLKYYNKMLNYCQNTIIHMDENMKTDLFFTVEENIPDCKEYDPLECLKFISLKLRQENFDTMIISSTKLFITWKYIELKLKQNEI